MTGPLEDRLRARLAPFGMAPESLLERDPVPGGGAPGTISANRSCRLLPTSDGWVALNLARAEDRDLVPAFGGSSDDPWRSLASAVRGRTAADVREQGIELQMPIAVLGEAAPQPLARPGGTRVPRKVIDLSALWAGPLCAGLLARAGAEVVRIDSIGRPDPTPQTAPELDARINGHKSTVALDLREEEDRALLLDLIDDADVLVTSARPAALARMGLTVELCAHVTWVAITSHGFSGLQSERVGFGDDCAVAGGLVRWQDGKPQFLGDAIADPLTGLEAAIAVLDGGLGLLDFSLARVAAAWVWELK